MKKKLLFFLLCFFAATAMAQEQSGAKVKDNSWDGRANKRLDYRHDIRLGLGSGAMGGKSLSIAFNEFIAITSNVYLYYGYRIVKGLKVSMTLGYNQYYTGDWHLDGEAISYSISDNLRISPAVQYEWFNRGIVTMYSDLGFTWILPSDRVSPYGNKRTNFGYITPNVTPFGIIVGKKWYGCAEVFSLGARGTFNIGAGYRF